MCVCECVISALQLCVCVGVFEDHANCQSCAYKFANQAYLSSSQDWMQRGFPQATRLQFQIAHGASTEAFRRATLNGRIPQ